MERRGVVAALDPVTVSETVSCRQPGLSVFGRSAATAAGIEILEQGGNAGHAGPGDAVREFKLSS